MNSSRFVLRRCIAAGLATMLAQACVAGPSVALQPCLLRDPRAAGACVEALRLRVYVSFEAFPHEREAIASAAAMWEAASGGVVRIEFVASESDADAEITFGDTLPPNVAITRRYGVPKRIVLDRDAIRASVGSFEGVVAHELGHALGLEHVNAEDALMAPCVHEGMRVTDADLRALYEMLGAKL